MYLCAPKRQGSLSNMGCTKAERFGAAQHGSGSCWKRGGSMHCGENGKPAPEGELMDPTAPSPVGSRG
eukprot:scaffold84528_cov25-Tisochrysis_lutea.AAC.2